MAALAIGSTLAIVPPALPGGATASAAQCPKSGCGWGPEQWARWEANNPKTATFLKVFDWFTTLASLSPAGQVRGGTFSTAFRGASLSRPVLPRPTSPVRAFPAVEAASTRALGEINEAVSLLDEAAAGPGLTGEEVQPAVDAARRHAGALAQDLQALAPDPQSAVDGTVTDEVLIDEIQSAADDLLQEAAGISDASAEGPVPNSAEVGSFDGDATAMSAAHSDIWNSSWHDEVLAEVKSDNGQLGKNNKAIKQLLGPAGKIGSVPGAADKYTRLVGEFADSLASPTKPAADAMVKFGNLQKEFSAPNKQGMEMTYLPKGNLDNVREAIAAKRMFEAGIADFKPGKPVNGLTPDYGAADETFVGDAVRMSGQKTDDAVRSGIKAKIGEKVGVYADKTRLPVRVVIDASDNPALDSGSLTAFQGLVSSGVRSAPAADVAKLKDVVVLGPSGRLVQTDPSGNVLKSVQGVRVKRSGDPNLTTRITDQPLPLVNPKTGKCLDAPDSGRAGVQVVIKACDGSAGQKFTHNSANRHIEVNGGRGTQCLDARWISAGFFNRASAPVELVDCRYADTWNLNADGTISTWYVLQSRTGCLDITGDSRQDGAAVGWYDCHAGYDNQRFIQPDPPAPPYKPATISSFSSGFEPSDPAPTWTDTPDDADGSRSVNVHGFNVGGHPEAGVRIGERSHTGTGALMYSGLSTSDGTHAYMKVYDLSSSPLAIGTTYADRKTLRYWIYPQGEGTTFQGKTNSACVTVDLVFTDDTTLRDSWNSWDQRGHRIEPAEQCTALTLDTWNQVTVTLDDHKGKQISRILVSYESKRTGAYRGYIDDITIS
ncbi:ricin-type beta-trefoil lectin domain protein [Streptomyces sp. NPDC049887]|uniref:ricin-type beta-trefoil lectin domain protein n=1 Tax=Streptomyces sp. NPDC049887 TaxID=3155654 RepID=UPI00342AB3AD